MPSKPNSPGVFWLPIGELHAKLVAKEFSCEELTNSWLSRLETIAPKYNALALSLRKPAISRAKDIDKELKRGRTRGALQGIPYGAKDLVSFAKFPTGWGAKPYAGQVFDEHATVVKKLDKAGAICIGKLGMVELAGGGGYRYPAASVTGPGLNPWDTGRWSGGSSSGPGSAVAAGLVSYALASETWGSIAVPAAYCGVTGLRPTYGLVSRAGAMALSWTLDKIGPMCRNAVDCGLVLAQIAGGDSGDPGSAGKSFYYAPEYVRQNKDITIGYAPRDLELIADPAVVKVFADTYAVFREMGFPMKEVSLPAMPYSEAASTIIGCEASSIFEELISSGKVDQLADQNQIQGLKAAFDYTARDYLKAMRVRRMVQDACRTVFNDVDVLLAPSRINVASAIEDPLDKLTGITKEGVTLPSRGLRDLSPAGNLAGLPLLSMPCGFVNGLPLGISVVSRPFQENLILGVGQRYQERTDWHKRRPKVD
ncbi:MAG: amidase [Acidobacteria bacterium]|nr:amidase [Acidobacteriota bacterium]